MQIAKIAGAVKRAVWGEASADDPFRITGPLRLSAFIVLGLVAIAVLWASTARLDSAVIASGVVSVETKRKKVEHLQGGIIERVLVRDGDVVHAGQSLLVLNQTETSAALNILLTEQDSVLALEARLDAERTGSETLHFADQLIARAADPSAIAAIEGQRSLFAQRNETLASEIRVLESRREQYSQIVSGLEAQVSSIARQVALIEKETVGVQALYDKQLARLPQLLELKRTRAALDGQRGALIASIAENKLKASEIDMQILNLKNERLDKIAADMREAQNKRFELAARIKAASDAVRRMTIVAPSDGVVVSLKVHSPGEVVRGGDTLLELVPQNDRMVIEAQIRPDDADSVRPGSLAHVRLSPFKMKQRPVVDGKVRWISADRLIDERSGTPYYLAEIEVDRSAVRAALGNETLQPGMPAEVMISLGSQTALDYIVGPLDRRLQHAMREQ